MEKVESRHYDPPLPVSLIGTKSGDQVNFMTCAWFSRVEVDPYIFCISIQKKHFTHKAILENKCFSINIPPVDLLSQVDAVGMVSGHEYDKSEIFEVFYGDNKNCPMVDGSIVSIECEVVNSVDLVEADEEHSRAHTLFIGKVKNVWVNKKAVKDGTLDYKTLNPIIWTMSPNSYWTIGENKGRAFNSDNIKLVPKKE
jgi:flavin reductase (DIM6/NTAB) family NADH-FMN oxidoreductase RutF